MKAWLGLGSNLQHPVTQLREALKQLNTLDSVEVMKTSSFYRTAPWGDKFQDDFINAVVQIETSLDAVSLLGEVQLLEDAMGRRRGGRRWGPRIIDIDLLLYGDQQYQSDKLVVPHPHMHKRAFVLMPLAELDDTLEIPGLGAIGQYLEQLDCSGISLLAEGS